MHQRAGQRGDRDDVGLRRERDHDGRARARRTRMQEMRVTAPASKFTAVRLNEPDEAKPPTSPAPRLQKPSPINCRLASKLMAGAHGERLADGDRFDRAHQADRERGPAQTAQQRRGRSAAQRSVGQMARQRLDVAHDVHAVTPLRVVQAEYPDDQRREHDRRKRRRQAAIEAPFEALQSAARRRTSAARGRTSWVYVPCSERQQAQQIEERASGRRDAPQSCAGSLPCRCPGTPATG